MQTLKNLPEARNHFTPMSHQILYSKSISIFTKYGPFSMKLYKDTKKEYLVLSSLVTHHHAPIVCVHSTKQMCRHESHDNCHRGDQLALSLKTIRKSGGLLIYTGVENERIPTLLTSLKCGIVNQGGFDAMYVQETRSAYDAFGFIFEDLALKSIQLVSDDANVIESINLLGVEIRKVAPSISFKYGS